MANRFFTADFHLGMDSIIEFESRPFASIDEMNYSFISQCESLPFDDTIIHVGDLACFRTDRHSNIMSNGLVTRPFDMFKNVSATFVNIRGNHDLHNRVKSLCESMTLRLGKTYPNVVAGHYPSYDPRSHDYIRDGWICLCGHVHSRWRHCLDLDRHVLNVNVGVDVWKYRLVSEDMLCRYIGMLFRHKPDDLDRCRFVKGKLKFQRGKINDK